MIMEEGVVRELKMNGNLKVQRHARDRASFNLRWELSKVKVLPKGSIISLTRIKYLRHSGGRKCLRFLVLLLLCGGCL